MIWWYMSLKWINGKTTQDEFMRDVYKIVGYKSSVSTAFIYLDQL